MKNVNSNIFFHNSSTNETQIWFMDGRRIGSRGTVLAEDGNTPIFIGAPWGIVGANDFNGDKGTDIFWHNSSDNGTQIWFMDGRRISGRAPLVAEDGRTNMFVSPPWSIVGTGDFNKNGNADILFRNTSDNGTQIWFMNGARISSRAPLVAENGRTNMFVGPPWSIVGVGDFNNDGGADILFHNSSTNETQIWFMDGARISSRVTVTSEDGRTPIFVGPPWTVVGVGDFNKDGGADILWVNTSTLDTQIWFMDGARISGRAPLVAEDGRTPMFVGPPWSIVGVGTDELSAVKESMRGAWDQFGGPRSFLGLPLGNQIEVSKANGQYQSHFRSGTLHLLSSGGTPTSNSRDVVNITLLGIECQIKQEVTDEIYGVVSVFGPSGGTLSTKRFPDSNTLNMGPPGLRIVNLNLPILVQGVVQNYTILATLFENDSGDVDVIAKNISDKIASSVAAGIGALTGAPAESVADSESFKEGLVTGVKFLFGDILGVGDDPFNPESLDLRWEDLQPNSPRPIQPPLQRNDDPRTIANWTHRVTLSGRDSGNDLGQYALYFRVDSETITTTPN